MKQHPPPPTPPNEQTNQNKKPQTKTKPWNKMIPNPNGIAAEQVFRLVSWQGKSKLY